MSIIEIFSPIKIVSFSIALLLILPVFAILFRRHGNVLVAAGSCIIGLASMAGVAAGMWTVGSHITAQLVLPLGLPELPFHLRLDPLSGFFLFVIGLLSFFVAVYSAGYLRGLPAHRQPAKLISFYSLFIAGMFMVVIADDALFFLISWEIMAAASYFLVMFEDEKTENRRAAFLYLVIAHVGAIAILLSFGIMAGIATGFENFNGYTFDAMRHSSLPVEWATAAFFLSFFGFAAKAGVMPLHVWLPEAHPVAPSNISALMSGVMLKTAIYGIVRITFDILKVFPWWWGAVVLVLGLISAVMGVLYALMQQDLKKLLAYSSVENIGIILIGIGLAMIFISFHLPLLAALALIAALYHILNHAMFKGLLFMGAGAVLHATRKRNMEEMGGLIHFMPWTAALFLIGCISISALPPFNGFVSEWLTFQAFLLSPSLPFSLIRLLIPLGAALLALTGALAAACFVRAFGVTFLGHWRGHGAPQVHEADWFMRAGMIMAATACIFLGIFPTLAIEWMDIIPEQLIGSKLSTSAGAAGWMWLTPIAPERASYSGLVVLFGFIMIFAAAYFILHIKESKIRRVPIWDCGFAKLNPRMQYNATSFSMPIRRIFGFLFAIKEHTGLAPQSAHPAFPAKLQYHLRVRDRFWSWIYMPVTKTSFWLSRGIGNLQRGRIQTYLIYSFVTIIILLMFVR